MRRSLRRTFFRPEFGPQFGLKIRGRPGPTGPLPLDPPLLCFTTVLNLFFQRMHSTTLGIWNLQVNTVCCIWSPVSILTAINCSSVLEHCDECFIRRRQIPSPLWRLMVVACRERCRGDFELLESSQIWILHLRQRRGMYGRKGKCVWTTGARGKKGEVYPG